MPTYQLRFTDSTSCDERKFRETLGFHAIKSVQQNSDIGVELRSWLNKLNRSNRQTFHIQFFFTISSGKYKLLFFYYLKMESSSEDELTARLSSQLGNTLESSSDRYFQNCIREQKIYFRKFGLVQGTVVSTSKTTKKR